MTIQKRLAFFALAIILILNIALAAAMRGAYNASAATVSAVEQDLSTLKIDGKAFKASDYPTDPNGAPQVIYLNEIGYFKADKMQYALVLYVYNPAQLNVRTSSLNAVQIKAGRAARYAKYALTLTSISGDRRFIRFSVKLNQDELAELLRDVSEDPRTYEVSSLELHVTGYNATDYAIARTFAYSGYYGADMEGSVTYSVSGGTETLPINCYHTAWRPEGTNGKDEHTQDSLESVYFAVPDELEQQYDYLNSVHCRWLEAVTAPMVVTDNGKVLAWLEQLFALWSYTTQVMAGSNELQLPPADMFRDTTASYSVLANPWSYSLGVTDYKRRAATVFVIDGGAVGTEGRAYIAQETFYLDFDLIDFEYVKKDVSYVVPVLMSPIDITPGLTPPPEYLEPGRPFWQIGCAIIGGLVLLGVVYGIIKAASK